MSKRRAHSPEFKARVAMEAISGRKTIQEIAADLFTRSKKTKDKKEGQAKEAELFHQIGRLQMELEWLKKVSAALMPMNCASSTGQFMPNGPRGIWLPRRAGRKLWRDINEPADE
jgi:hypothetical protein